MSEILSFTIGGFLLFKKKKGNPGIRERRAAQPARHSRVDKLKVRRRFRRTLQRVTSYKENGTETSPPFLLH